MYASPNTSTGGDSGPIVIPSVIPLFPLPNVVFFPRTYLPLHVFEPRYRHMVQDAAASHRMIGMVLLKEGWESDYEGRPPIFPTGAVGRMVAVQNLSDGRFNVLLQGLRRFEIKDEIGLESYRQGSIELKDFAPLETKLPPELRVDIMKIVGNFLLSQEDGAALTNFLKQPVDDETLVHNLSFGLDFTPLEKQFLLEAETVVQQARRLLDLLQFKRYERHDSAGWG